MSSSDIDVGAAAGIAPTRTIWVSASAPAGGDGSAGHPFSTIQAAVNVATPGTAIMVQAGTYVENVKFPSNAGGTSDNPIQLISADGQGAAKVIAADNSISTIKGLGVHDIVVKGFEVEGGLNGIQFSQSGSDFTHLVSNVVVQGNIVSNTVQDGVKISQADGVRILDNTIAHTGGEGVDFVAVNNSIIARNDVSFAQGAAGIFTKGGSTNDLVTGNMVHDILKDGIEIGGWTTDAYFRPGFDTYEAKDITVTGNTVTGVGQRPLNVLGALHSEATNNHLTANSAYQTAIEVGTGANKAMISDGISISGNVIDGAAKTLYLVDPGNGAVSFQNNATTGDLGLHDGPLSAWLSPEALFVATATGGAVPSPVQASSAPAPVVGGVSIYNGTSASETLVGTGLHNAMYGGGGNDSLVGGASDDTLDGGSGVDTMVGGAGNDVYVVSSNSDSIVELPGGGTDTVYTTLTTVRLPWANVENAVFTGNAAANIVGNDLDNSLVGGAFNDSIDGGAGADTLVGGLGDDLYFVHDGRTQIIEAAGGGTDTVKSDVSFVLSANVENLLLVNPGLTGVGNELDNKITGTAGGDAMYGGAGNDTLLGNDGNDTLDGGIGADRMLGGKGDDIYYVDDPGDVVIENAGEGTDTIYVSLQDYTLVGNVENLIGVADGGQQLTGNTLANVITGGDGNDTLHGGGGADTLIGGAGDDTYYVEDAREKVVEAVGGGYDTVIVANGAWVPDAGQEIERIVAAAGTTAMALHGNEFSQLLIGNAGANVIDGGGGVDTMQGGAGNDTYIVDNVADAIVENPNEGVDIVQASVSYTLPDNVENLTLTTSGLTGTGNAQANVIVGTAGADTLIGGGDADTLTGGAGADVFVYQHLSDKGDTITDFQVGVDHLNVQGLMAELGSGAALSYAHTATGLNVYVDHDGAHDLLVFLQGVADASLTADSFDWSSASTLAAAVVTAAPVASDVISTILTPSPAASTTAAVATGTTTGTTVAASSASTTTTTATTTATTTVATSSTAHAAEVAPQPTIVGTASADTLAGTAGADWISAGAGNDVVKASAGNDQIDGGDGSDTVTFAGFAANYTINLANGAGTVSGGPEGGTTTLSSIETVHFLDGDLTFDLNSQAAQIVRLYDAFLGRAPDTAGLNGYLQYMASGHTLADMAANAAASTEFQSHTASLTDAQYVDYVYETSLHRHADASGLATYVADLANGTFTRTSLILQAAESPEHVALTAAAVQAGIWQPNQTVEALELLYDASVQRAPDASGIAGYTAMVAAGSSFKAIANQMANSAEFLSHHASQTDAEYVDSLYVAEVGRHADAAGLAAYTDQLAHGYTRGDILYETAMSQEHQTHVLAHYDPLLLSLA